MSDGKPEQLGIEIDPQLLNQFEGPTAGRVGTGRGRNRTQGSRTCRRAARGPYWPHSGQAVCGRCLARQAALAQVTRVGTDAFHWERRCLVLLRDIFRLGTATAHSLFPAIEASASSSGSVVQPDRAAQRGSIRSSCR